ncbi:MAG: cytochrome c biogenesis protein ResB [Thioalkalivibrionaceae bacterium]
MSETLPVPPDSSSTGASARVRSTSDQRVSFGRVALEFLGSMNLAITLLLALAIASVIGTVLVQNQPYTEYLIQFGPFWHEIFADLALYQVYGATWFIVVLSFLVLSTSVCVVRNYSGVMRDVSRLNTRVREKSLRAFTHSHSFVDHVQRSERVEHAERVLRAQGYRVRAEQSDGATVLAASKGGANRWGYLLTHIGIVVICVGAMIDGAIWLKAKEAFGALEIETRNIPASQVPEISRLGAWNPAFRGSVEIPEGSSAGVVFLPRREGYFVQELPFRVEVEAFRIQRHPNGMPRSYESDLVIYDPTLDEPLRQTIEVNHPLVHRGTAIYQASFADGGSRLTLDAVPLGAEALRSLEVPGRVFDILEIPSPDGRVRTLELNDFQLENVVPFEDEATGRRTRQMGPSFDFRLVDETGQGMYYRNYMSPLVQEGALYFLSGVRESPTDEFRYLFLPADDRGTLDRYRTLLAMLHQRPILERIAANHVQQTSNLLPGDPQRDVIERTIVELMSLFARGGYAAVAEHVEARVPAGDEQGRVAEVLANLLHSGLQSLYVAILDEEGVTEIGPAQQRFLEDAISAINAQQHYDSPYFFMLTDFDHLQASGLQIARAPGQNIVYFGSLILIIGIFLMFYVSYRRVWVMARDSDGHDGVSVVVAGTANRKKDEFDEEFGRLTQWVEETPKNR